MKIYKLKHIPTGLYYKPFAGSGSNLSKNGKVYTKRPPSKEPPVIRVTFISLSAPTPTQKIIIDYFNIPWNGGYTNNRYINTQLQDWEVEEVKTVNSEKD